MPTYEYKCMRCNHNFEVFQSIKDDPVTICPKCKGDVKRLIGAGVGIIFKGSGFYTTDYKKTSASIGTNGKNSKKNPENTDKGKTDKENNKKTDKNETSS